MKVRRLIIWALPIIGKFPRGTSISAMYMAFQIPYVCDSITKLCRKQKQIIKNHENARGRNIAQGEAFLRKYKGLKLGGCQRVVPFK
jgi:hypothetical protein